MNTVHEIFDAIGGATRVAGIIDVNPSTASEMKRRQSIPVKHWPKLIAWCKANRIKGLSYVALVRMHTEQSDD